MQKKSTLTYPSARDGHDKNSTKRDAVIRAVEFMIPKLPGNTGNTTEWTKNTVEQTNEIYESLVHKDAAEISLIISDLQTLSEGARRLMEAITPLLLVKTIAPNMEMPTADEVRKRLGLDK